MLLEIKRVETGYGGKQVLFDVSIEIDQGEVVAIIGPNGAGKSTVLRAACGLLPVWQGDVVLDGKRIVALGPAENVSHGLTFCPQGNLVFHGLTVRENLEIGGYSLPRGESKVRVEEVLELFPALKKRVRQNAGTLSGGEQQMLALGRALVPKPMVLMLDEPSLGLAPNLLATVFSRITEINRKSGVAILIVEQKVREVLEICNRVYSMKLGRVAFEGQADELRKDRDRLKDLFL